ncbi:MAG TPA: AAA family ATPase [Pyrinomonadaceae bacterium]|nr:hypothetical protein [Verrucomicrobiales bacterium]HRI04923.1 AAA family ATPase [Pyrinomonadaceae bacterium]
MSVIDLIHNACQEDHGAILLHGRGFYDLVCDDGKIRPLFEAVRRMLYREFGMLFATFSKAHGLNWFESWITNERDRQTVRGAFQKSGILAIKTDQNETIAMLRATTELLRSGTADLTWQDGRPLRVGICFEFAEHFSPCMAPGSQTEAQLVIAEHIHITSQSLALRKSGNKLFFHGRLQHMDELASAHLKKVRLPQPDMNEKLEFTKAAIDIYPNARFEDGLDVDGVVAFTVHTPNRSLEGQLRASDRTGRPLTAAEIAEQKNADVHELSEGTLRPLDTRRVIDLKLVGQNIKVPRKFLKKWARMLREGDPSTPANVLLGGCAASGKTDLCLETGRLSQLPNFQMLSTKDGLVGGTERKTRVQHDVLRAWEPNVAFVDEFTETFPVDRGGFNGDSGASLAVIAELLTALSDQTRCGRSILLATTNRVHTIGSALLTRFVVLPVLFPLREDFPAIIVEIARKALPGSGIDANDPKVIEAGAIFYSKGAGPRDIRSAITTALVTCDSTVSNADLVLFAANDFIPRRDFLTIVYADLQAIRHCTSKSFLPWAGEAGAVGSIPEYLNGIVDPKTGDLDLSALDAKIKELEPYNNV